MLTSDQLQCFYYGRPDILPFYAANGWPVTPDYYEQIARNWFNMIKAKAQVADDGYQFGSLEEYVLYLGCVATTPTIPVPINTSPGAGSNIPAQLAGNTGGFGSEFDNAIRWVGEHQVAAAGLAVLGFLLIYKPVGLGFGREK